MKKKISPEQDLHKENDGPRLRRGLSRLIISLRAIEQSTYEASR